MAIQFPFIQNTKQPQHTHGMETQRNSLASSCLEGNEQTDMSQQCNPYRWYTSLPEFSAGSRRKGFGM